MERSKFAHCCKATFYIIGEVKELKERHATEMRQIKQMISFYDKYEKRNGQWRFV